MRDAASLVLAARLQAEGARVTAFDPVAEDVARGLITGVEFCPSAMDCAEGCDAIVLVTEWNEFRELDFAEVARRMRGNLVLDGRNFLDPTAIQSAGLTYEGVGRK
jgi:UDPglucose 6-dehydrogenase